MLVAAVALIALALVLGGLALRGLRRTGD